MTMSRSGDLFSLVTIQFMMSALDVARTQLRGSDIGVWNVATGRRVFALQVPNALVQTARLTPDSRRIVLSDVQLLKSSAGNRSSYTVIDLASRRTRYKLPGPAATAEATAPPVFTRDGRFMAAVSARNTVGVWDLDTGAEVTSLPEHRAQIAGLAISPDGSRAASVTAEGGVRVFDARSGRPLVSLKPSSGPYAIGTWSVTAKALLSRSYRLQFSDDGSRLMLTSILPEPGGAKIAIETWDGSPR